MKISVGFEGVDTMIARLGGFAKQVDFAASRTLNALAKNFSTAMPDEIGKSFDRPTPFSQRGVRVLRYANKSNLSATAGFMDAQARYMQWQINGGTRPADSSGVRLPSAIKTDQYGNIPRGVIKQLLAVAKKERRLGRVKARRVAVSATLELFYGEPVVDGKSWPRGIYKRVGSEGKHRLIPVVVFPSTQVRYGKRLRFFEVANEVVRRDLAAIAKRELDQAMSTAR